MSTSEGLAQQNLARATVDFLCRTNEFYRNAQQWAATAPFRLPDFDEQVAKNMEGSRRVVNDCIQSLGGLSIGFTDSETGQSSRCRVGAWLGYDPETQGNLLWTIRGAPPGTTVSLAPAALDELRNEL